MSIFSDKLKFRGRKKEEENLPEVAPGENSEIQSDNESGQDAVTDNRFKLVKKAFFIASVVCYVIAAVAALWLVISRFFLFHSQYQSYMKWLDLLENNIAAMGNYALIIFVIILMYYVKTAIFIYPYSLLVVASAMVFKPVPAFFLSAFGYLIVFTIRYYTGVLDGAKGLQSYIHKSSAATRIVEGEDGKGSPWVLFFCRFISGIPINTVSNLYGAMNFGFGKFLIFSYLGICPKIAMYILIGRSIKDPFSLNFILPILISALVAGITLTIIKNILGLVEKMRAPNNGPDNLSFKGAVRVIKAWNKKRKIQKDMTPEYEDLGYGRQFSQLTEKEAEDLKNYVSNVNINSFPSDEENENSKVHQVFDVNNPRQVRNFGDYEESEQPAGKEDKENTPENLHSGTQELDYTEFYFNNNKDINGEENET